MGDKSIHLVDRVGLARPSTKKVIALDANLRLVWERDGKILEDLLFHNVITKTGLAAVASRINGAGSEAAFAWIGIGITATAESENDTALLAERDQSGATNTNHKAATVSRVTTTDTNDTARHVTTFNISTSLSVAETGLFNATPGGVMLARKGFTALPFIAGDNFTVTWDIICNN